VARYPKGDPRYVATPEEALASLRSLSVADVRKAYADFYGATTGEISVVGDFDETALRAQLDTMFMGWKSKSPFTPLRNVVFDTKAASEDIDTPDKANAILVAVTTFPLSDHDPDYPAMLIANYIMGGSGMTSRLTARIRVKDGLSYAAQSGFNADRRDRSGVFQGVAIYAPQNADKVLRAFFEEIDRARKDGFTAEEVESAKTGLLQNNQLSRAQDAVLAGQLVTNMSLGRSMQYAADLDKQIQAATIAQVNAAFNKYVDPTKIITVRAGDLSKAKSPIPPKP
jgi:zinc protease